MPARKVDAGSVPRGGISQFSSILYRKTFVVDGMHCEHHKNRVEEVINDIQGVIGRVNLKKGEVTVSYAEEVADDVIKARIEKAGYTVVD